MGRCNRAPWTVPSFLGCDGLREGDTNLIGQTGANYSAAKRLWRSMYGMHDQIHLVCFPSRAGNGPDGHSRIRAGL